MNPAQLSAMVAEATAQSKFDVLLNKEQFNESQRKILIAAEIHDLFERDEIDLVMEDGATKDCELVTADKARVLLIHPTCRYQAWRNLYDKI